MVCIWGVRFRVHSQSEAALNTSVTLASRDSRLRAPGLPLSLPFTPTWCQTGKTEMKTALLQEVFYSFLSTDKELKVWENRGKFLRFYLWWLWAQRLSRPRPGFNVFFPRHPQPLPDTITRKKARYKPLSKATETTKGPILLTSGRFQISKALTSDSVTLAVSRTQHSWKWASVRRSTMCAVHPKKLWWPDLGQQRNAESFVHFRIPSPEGMRMLIFQRSGERRGATVLSPGTPLPSTSLQGHQPRSSLNQAVWVFMKASLRGYGWLNHCSTSSLSPLETGVRLRVPTL